MSQNIMNMIVEKQNPDTGEALQVELFLILESNLGNDKDILISL